MMGAARPLKNDPASAFDWLKSNGLKPIALYAPGMVRDQSKPDELTNGKEPKGNKWGLRDWTIDDWRREDLRCREEVGVGAGVGICLGPDRGPGGTWLIDIEGDGERAEASLATLLGGEVINTMGWRSVRGRHRLYTADVSRLLGIMPGLKPLEGKGQRSGVYKTPELPDLELRIGGKKANGEVKQVQSACPPTPGTDGVPRTWNGPSAPVPVPEAFYETLSRLVVEVPAIPPQLAVEVIGRIAGTIAVERDEAWTRAALAGELEKLAATGSGDRNNQLNVAALKLGKFIPGGYVSRSVVEEALRQVARSIDLGPGEIERTIRSGIEAGMADPKRRPERDVTPAKPTIGVYRGPAGGTNEDADDPREPRPNESPDDPHRLARVYLDANHRHPDHTTLVYHNGEFHRWDTAYRPLPIQAVRAALTTSAKAEFDRINLADLAEWTDKGSKGRKPTVGKVTTALTNNVVQALGGDTLLDGQHAAPCWLGEPARWPAAEVLPTRNALLHLPSFADGIGPHRIPPTPLFFCPYATDYDLDESAPRPANFLAFLDRLWPDDPDSIAALQEWFGYHLTPDTSQEKIGMLIGPKRSGKGTIAKVLTAMIGEANVCNPKFGALGSQFGTESLIGKMAAIITDARITSRTDIAQVVENLLTISGTDRQTIARKHKTDWSGNLPTKFTIISNELPRLADASGALPGRMIIFQLKQSFYGQEDTRLFSAKIRPEMPGILLWAIEGWKRLRDRGRLNQPQSGQQLVEEMEELSSPISVFLREKCIVEAGREVMTTDLYEAWTAWCEAMGNKNPGDQTALGRNLRSVMPHLVTKPCRHGNGYARKYMGIDLANPHVRAPRTGPY